MQIWTYIDTNSRKLNQVKIVIIICQTSNQSATMEQNYQYCSSVYFLTAEVLTYTQVCQQQFYK